MLPTVQNKCTEQQVQNYFNKLRTTVRTFILRLQRNAAGPAAATPSALPGEPARGLAELSGGGDAVEGQHPGSGTCPCTLSDLGS